MQPDPDLPDETTSATIDSILVYLCSDVVWDRFRDGSDTSGCQRFFFFFFLSLHADESPSTPPQVGPGGLLSLLIDIRSMLLGFGRLASPRASLAAARAEETARLLVTSSAPPTPEPDFDAGEYVDRAARRARAAWRGDASLAVFFGRGATADDSGDLTGETWLVDRFEPAR
jgi:hypothetical protein